MTDYLTDAANDIKVYFETHDIPIYFYQCFFGELVKICGINFLIPDKYYDAEYDDDGNIIEYDDELYSYEDQIGYFLTCQGGTGGWYEAFKEACKQCDLMDIHEDYCQLCWLRSDIFDGYIADRMLEVLFDDTRHNDYYRFKIQKEKENER